MENPHTQLALDYFAYLAKRFPVMCASDEFHFLPRAEKAGDYYDQLDHLDSDTIEECLATLREFQNECDLFAVREDDLETRIDLALLKASAAGTLIELEMKQIWRHNPLLYLKIAFIGLDHALTKPATEPKEQVERACARLETIPRLLKQAVENLESVPKTYYHAALAMVCDCKTYLGETKKRLLEEGWKHRTGRVQETQSALDAFRRFLQALIPVPDQEFAASAFQATIRDHFASVRTLTEIFQVAVEEWQDSLEELEKLQTKIDDRKSWKALYEAYCPVDIERLDTMSLYQQEIDRLGAFFRKSGFKGVRLGSLLELCETPTYLRSVRSAASFSAALRANAEEKDCFYITTSPPQERSKKMADLLKRRLHREYQFLTAHETVPGHYLLDNIRRDLANPVRRQIESPLFYEGWAYYAELLLTEYGYVDRPIDYLVDCKRRLWRAARCQIDVGMTTGRLARQDAMELLKKVGFAPEEANIQIDRFQLNPGYQLCYTLGRYEIMRLREIYGSQMGLDSFHRHLLEGGELPFHLIAERFEACDFGGRKADKE